jgi:inorganic triphosphatase YgiF
MEERPTAVSGALNMGNISAQSLILCAKELCGCIEATGRSELISEVEFKLKGGRLNSYTQECLSFLAEVPAALLIESKAARGYRLAAGELPQAIGAPHLVVPWNLPLPQAILRILRHGFQHFLDNYPAVTLAGEPEGIHQMRVAMRRLLSAIRMFAPVLRLEDTRGLFQALKTIFTQLRGVREADVFIAETGGQGSLWNARRLASHAHCCEEIEICRRAPVPGLGTEDRHRTAVKAAQPAAEFAWAPQ